MQNHHTAQIELVAADRLGVHQVIRTAFYVHGHSEQSDSGLHLAHSTQDDSGKSSSYTLKQVIYLLSNFSIILPFSVIFENKDYHLY